jgi:UDP-N-acetylmuramate dehydrogenase
MFNLTVQENRSYKKIMSVPKKPEGLKGRLKMDEPMSRHTSWRVGGSADRFFIPHDLNDLKLFISQLDDAEPITWIGLGSNLLVRDGGIRGTVIATKNMDENIEKISTTDVQTGAGISCAQLAKYSVKAGLTGAEFLVGIPGTLGGALAMNAGAFGSETWDIVKAVSSINRKGEVYLRSKSEYSIGYRNIKKPSEEWFVRAILTLQPDLNHSGKNMLRNLLNKRGKTQPIGEASCGSVFRNPEAADPAAKLIDSCGLKGTCIGNACVSEKHANFIINRGNASAKDIESLILHIKETVYTRTKISLIPEVQIVGVNN